MIEFEPEWAVQALLLLAGMLRQQCGSDSLGQLRGEVGIGQGWNAMPGVFSIQGCIVLGIRPKGAS